MQPKLCPPIWICRGQSQQFSIFWKGTLQWKHFTSGSNCSAAECFQRWKDLFISADCEPLSNVFSWKQYLLVRAVSSVLVSASVPLLLTVHPPPLTCTIAALAVVIKALPTSVGAPPTTHLVEEMALFPLTSIQTCWIWAPSMLISILFHISSAEVGTKEVICDLSQVGLLLLLWSECGLGTDSDCACHT